MSIAKITEISAESADSFEDAVRKGIARADKTLKHIRGAWVQEQQVIVDKGRVKAFRVNLKVTFVLED